ncbi:hypothetical protein EV137_6771 [Kribbella pratensis]|uniref:Uncharacterized protein n=2 Tax=Kribbella pratensis TaxID=2512112 RepID=A0ABY2F6H2_9ACTN|nr:hypothetical protein EV137_6771 [Kribbella pratensis]
MGHFGLWTTRIEGRNHGTFTGMSFENLSATWADEPLTDPDATADAVDLMVSLGDRRRGTFTILICDPDDHYLATVAIELPATFSLDSSAAQLCETALHPIIPAVHTAPGTALVLVLGRPGPARMTGLDAQWARAAGTICAAAGIRLLGFYVATEDGIYQPALTESAAA